MKATDDVGESFSLNWDESGQLKNIPYTGTTTSLVYNWDGKLRKGTIDGNSIELKYDPAGNRIYTDSSVNGERKYIVDIIGDLPVILLEFDPNNGMNIEKTYIYANGQILAQHDGDYTDSRYFYLHDRLGSVRQIMDTSGDVVMLYTYNPFGEVAESDGTFANPWRFTGQWYDDEIDQYYLRARMYDPHIYRFSSRDPVFGKFAQPLTFHKYLYCINNPVTFIDPDGREIRLGWAKALEIYGVESYHSLLHIIPENQAAYFTVTNAQYFDIETMQMSFTIDAGPSNYAFYGLGYLEARLRPSDENDHLVKDSYDYCVLGHEGMTEDDVIASLVAASSFFEAKQEHRSSRLNYTLYPGEDIEGYNSNSFMSGLLNAVGLENHTFPVPIPGWNNPVPASYFFQNYSD